MLKVAVLFSCKALHPEEMERKSRENVRYPG
jgi:hypothetical protein